MTVGTAGQNSVLTAQQISTNLGGPSNRATNNLLIGLSGNDTITAGPGTDFAYGGDGNNVLNGYTGKSQGNIDVLVGGSGSDALNAGSGYDLMIGDAASATFTANSKQFPNTANIIWGDSQSNTYQFSGNNVVCIDTISNPTIQSIETQYANSTGFSAGGIISPSLRRMHA